MTEQDPASSSLAELALPNPLHDLHVRADAEFQSYGGVEIVCTFGEPQAEYSALHKGCALTDLPQRGILQVGGTDRLDFLNRLLTNQLIDKDTKTPIPAGAGVYAFLLNEKGRIVTDINVLERGDFTLLEADARMISALEAALKKYAFREKVTFASQIGQLHQIALHGPRSGEILRLCSPELALPEPLGSAAGKIFDAPVTVWRDDPVASPGYFLILPTDAAAGVWQTILAKFATPETAEVQKSKRAVWPCGWAAFNAARIEAGRPLFGIDFDGTVLPAETGQFQRAVNVAKGCYVGQEIVVRMYARQQIPRQVVGIKMELDALPVAGASVFDAEQNRVGQITSSTISPILSNAALCLAMVKKPFYASGAKLHIAAEGAIRIGFVVDLPFVLRKEA
ncbi:MAG: glycine cleavage T C-terminal barrel domain-containing protein [Tepidisphaeraceae bacterium]